MKIAVITDGRNAGKSGRIMGDIDSASHGRLILVENYGIYKKDRIEFIDSDKSFPPILPGSGLSLSDIPIGEVCQPEDSTGIAWIVVSKSRDWVTVRAISQVMKKRLDVEVGDVNFLATTRVEYPQEVL